VNFQLCVLGLAYRNAATSWMVTSNSTQVAAKVAISQHSQMGGRPADNTFAVHVERSTPEAYEDERRLVR
jgi:hypothetical protein